MNLYRGFARTKKLITIAVIFVLLVTTFLVYPALTKGAWFGAGGATGTWNYRQKITIDRTKVADTDGSKGETNFPVLISVTNVTFKSIANGGHVGLDTGYDIVFTSGDGKTKLAHEIEKYDATTGQLIAWVKVPKVASDVNTTIYMYYGNAAETGNEQNATAVWDSNYQGVYHLSDGTTLSMNNSKGTNNAVNASSTLAIDGKMDGGGSFVSSNKNYLSLPSAIFGNYPTSGNTSNYVLTFETWFKTATNGVILGQSDNTTPPNLPGAWTPALYVDTNGKLRSSMFWHNNVSYQIVSSGTYKDDLWHHVAVVYNSGVESLYIDGSYAGTQTRNEYGYNAVKYYLGTGYVGNGWVDCSSGWVYFNGRMDETRVSSSARSADWIKTEYNNQNSPSTFATFNGEETQPTAQVKGAWFNSSWSYRKKLTIDKTKVSTVSGTTNTNFPVLVSMTDASLKSTTNGGHMGHASAYDLVFTDSSGTVKLNHEIEKYDATTGQIIAWVQLPTLAPANDTDIYLYYGNASVSTSQANPSGVWDSNYKGVWHLNETLTGAGQTSYDSTSNVFDLTSAGTWAGNQQAAGKVGGSLNFNGSNDSLTKTAVAMTNTDNWTMEAWINPTNLSQLSGAIQNGSDDGATPAQKGYGFGVGNGSGVAGAMFQGLNTNVAWINTGYTFPQSAQWYHAVMQRVSGTIKFYINGTQTANTNASVPGTPAGNFYLGSQTGIRYFNGIIDEARVSSSVRTPDWIATEYNNQNDPSVGGFYKAYSNEEVVPKSNWYQAWGYRKKVIINHTQVSGTSTLAAFPVLVSVSADTLLRSTANGGHMASTTAADLLFTDLSGTKIPHEIEKYDPATGQLIVWVKTNVSPTTDTILYMYYGNPNVTVSQEDKTNVWSNGYAGVWHLGETSGQHADSTGVNNSTSVAVTAQGTATGQIDGADQFDGVSNKVTIADNNSLEGMSAVTFEAWIKHTSGGADSFQRIIDKSSNPYAFYINGNNLAVAFTTTGTGGTSDDWSAGFGNTVTDDTWQLVTFTWDSATGFANTSLNGILGTQKAKGGSNVATDANSFYIGDRSSSDRSFKGLIDEVRISNVARTADWIKTEYNNQNTPTSFVTLAGEESSIKTTVNTTWYSSDYGYRKKITIDHRKVSGSTALTDFPVLISLTDAQLKSVSNGGLVASSTAGDLLFTDSTGKTKIPFEIESYSPTTGTLIAWVKISSLSPSSDTAVYLYFGNSVITTMQANPTGVWDANYQGVWHLVDGSSLSGSDSIGVNNGSFSTPAPVATAGKIDGAALFNGSSNYITAAQQIFSSTDSAAPYTGSAWIKTSYAGTNGQPIILQYASGQTNRFVMYVTNIGADVGKLSYFKNGGNILVSGIRVNDGNLHYVAFTKTAAKTVTLFIDGVQSGSTVTDNTAMYATQTAIGGASGANYFNGTIDEVRISSTARTADWIKTEYNNQSAPSTFFFVGKLEVENRLAGTAGIGAVSRGAPSSWTHPEAGAWTSRKKLIIDHSKVSGKTALTDFPVLISLTDADWKTTANGGHMGKSDGTDLYFTSADGTTKLAHEIETYSPTTGALVAWVKIPSLSPTTDTTLYMYYGNASASDMQTVAPAKALVWDANYKGVYHLPNGTTLTSSDSTGQNNSTAQTATFATGKVDGAAAFNGSQRISLPNIQPTSALTLEAWVNQSNFVTFQRIIAKAYTANSAPFVDFALYVDNLNPSKILFGIDIGGVLKSIESTNTISQGVWYHVVGVYDGSFMRVYINGDSAATPVAQTGNIATVNQITEIGYNTVAAGEKWKGSIDEVRISFTPRTADWIKTEYNNQSAPTTFVYIGQKDSSARASSTPLMKLRGNGIQFR